MGEIVPASRTEAAVGQTAGSAARHNLSGVAVGLWGVVVTKFCLGKLTCRVWQLEALGQALNQADVILVLVLGQGLLLTQCLQVGVAPVCLGGQDDGGALPAISSCTADLH